MHEGDDAGSGVDPTGEGVAVVEPGRGATGPGRRVALAAAAGVTVIGLVAVGLWRSGGDDGGSAGVAALASEPRPDVGSTTLRPTAAPAPDTTVPVTTMPVTGQGLAEPAASVPPDAGSAPPATVASVEGVQVGVSADAPVEVPPVERAAADLGVAHAVRTALDPASTWEQRVAASVSDGVDLEQFRPRVDALVASRCGVGSRAVVARTFYLAPTWAQVLFTVEGPGIPEIARNMTQLVYALQGPDGVWRVTSTHLSSFVELALPFCPPG